MVATSCMTDHKSILVVCIANKALLQNVIDLKLKLQCLLNRLRFVCLRKERIGGV